MKIITTILLILFSFTAFSQNKQSVEFSLYGSIPDDYRKQRRATGNTPRVVDPTILCSGTGYDFYNTLGSGFITEYTNKFSKRFAYKVGIDLIVHSNYLNASVCWKEVMESYGKDKWYYPDPRCPKASKPKIKKYIY